ncbi:MAG: type II/IV secretion system protein [Patescibacteria group bacterium]
MTDFSRSDDTNAKLQRTHLEEAEKLAAVMAERYSIPYINLRIIPIDLDALKLIPESEARRVGVAVFERVARKLRVAVKNPELPAVRELIQSLATQRYQVDSYLASIPSLEHVWNRYAEIIEASDAPPGIVDIAVDRLRSFQATVGSIKELGALITTAAENTEKFRATDLLELILAGSLALDASDIHLEQEEKHTVLRYRLDGVLHGATSIPNEIYKLLLSRIKLVAELKLNVHDRAQDGRFTIRQAKADIEVRLSSLPGPYGESLVMRVLNPKTIALTLEDLGMQRPVYELISKELERPNGMIVTTGPTGSGKTTTLYAFIKKIQSPDIKIITIENPIEYHLQGITQTQVDAAGHYTFELGLAAILRQDPDVILIGEIRSLETAQTALHAALTGHLVFSTLHTNNAAGTIPRLIDIGVKPNIIAPAVNLAIAQRLVRKLCSHCKQSFAPNAEERARIETALQSIPTVHASIIPKEILVWRAPGCKECTTIGYKGRIGVYEALRIDDAVERLMLGAPSEADFFEAGRAQGMLTMYQDAMLKVIAGATSLEEVVRVVGSE